MKVTTAGTAVFLAALLFTQAGEAHKGITSKFTYNADVYPVFLKRCSRCHVDGGVGPMSLLRFEDAFPWAESLRTELLAPLAPEEAGDFVRAAHRQISARELDIVLDWATGGTPEGDQASTPVPAALDHTWVRGTPDLVVSMARPFEMAAETLETTQEFVLPIGVAEPRSATQLDLLPGTPAIVRSATISIRSKDGETRTLATWFPRQASAPIPLKPSARLEPGSQVIARIQYKKTWKFEGQAMSDQSAVGLYFAD